MEPPAPNRRRKPAASAAAPLSDEERDRSCPPEFEPARPRQRFDGWTPGRQVRFIEALAESGCVAEACRTVGMSERSAYALRARTDAVSFRNAWDAALDYAIRRLADAVLSRAINGVAVPVFFQGEQVGEKRYYDERLAMFLLRRRDPARYGQWIDRTPYRGHPEGDACALADAKAAVREDADLGADEVGDRVSQRFDELIVKMRWMQRSWEDEPQEAEEQDAEQEQGEQQGGENEGDVS